MKIIQHGNIDRLKKVIEFKCKLCGCVFQAEKGEYKYQYSQRDDASWYEAKCPLCGYLCIKTETSED